MIFQIKKDAEEGMAGNGQLHITYATKELVDGVTHVKKVKVKYTKNGETHIVVMKHDYTITVNSDIQVSSPVCISLSYF